ncbi:TetR/AcrR family transcriptional regulator [Pseudarthrobacter sp. N5]|uniref:TetR/AcrR family transcriptional regulator n=1 Tax=Pseudarthrobacter sp. N5 TaxID=3418416 RepID=UPI003CF91B3A
MARPLKPLISVDAVVTAALGLIDETGDFSLPKLARRIGVSQSSIYHHVSGREEILELVRGRLLSENPYSVPADAGWEEALRQMIRSYRGSFARHPRAESMVVDGDRLAYMGDERTARRIADGADES